MQLDLQICWVLKPRLFFLHLHSGLLREEEDPKEEDPKDEDRLFPVLILDVPETLDLVFSAVPKVIFTISFSKLDLLDWYTK